MGEEDMSKDQQRVWSFWALGMIKMFCDLQHLGFEHKASVNVYISSWSHWWTALADLSGYWYLCYLLGSRKAVLSRPTGTIQPFCYLLLCPRPLRRHTWQQAVFCGSGLTGEQFRPTQPLLEPNGPGSLSVSSSALQWVPLCLHGHALKPPPTRWF